MVREIRKSCFVQNSQIEQKDYEMMALTLFFGDNMLLSYYSDIYLSLLVIFLVPFFF